MPARRPSARTLGRRSYERPFIGDDFMADELTDVLVAGYPRRRHRDQGVRRPRRRRSRRRRSGSRARSSSATTRTTTSSSSRPATTSGARAWATAARSASSWAWRLPRCWRRPSSGPPPAGSSGRFAKHKMETGLHDKIGEALKPGTAAILAMFEEDQALAVQQVLAGALARSVVQTDKTGDRRPEGLARRGDGQVQPGPDRPADPGPELRRRGRPDHGRVRRRLVDDPRAQGARRAPRTSCSCSSTTPASAAPTRSAASCGRRP